MRKAFIEAEVARRLPTAPIGRAGWKARAEARIRSEAAAAYSKVYAAAYAFQKIALDFRDSRMVAPAGEYGGYSWRTETGPHGTREQRVAIRHHLSGRGLEACQYTRILPDGSGRGWNEWPGCADRRYPVGTFDRA